MVRLPYECSCVPDRGMKTGCGHVCSTFAEVGSTLHESEWLHGDTRSCGAKGCTDSKGEVGVGETEYVAVGSGASWSP